MSNSKIIGGKIAEARKRMNISQARLAQDLFISSQAVGKWERGESMPDITTFNRLAEILGVDLNYFSESFESSLPERQYEEARTIEGDRSNAASQSRSVVSNFTGSNLSQSDFAGVTLLNGKFTGSALRGTDFSVANLNGNAFRASDLRDTNFDDANLTDASFIASDLSKATFRPSTLVRTTFSMSQLDEAKFSDVTLTDVTLSMTDLRNVNFENCIFDGVDFDKSDLRGMCFDGLTFIGVKFHNSSLKGASFTGATLKNVSFQAPYALTNKFYKNLKTINFDGSTMDKITYAILKGFGVDLSKVIVQPG